MIELIQGELDSVNERYAQVEKIKKFVHPRPRPVAGDRRADADAEGQAQRRQREVRRLFDALYDEQAHVSPAARGRPARRAADARGS